MNFIVGNTYTFSTLAPTILEAVIKNARILGIINYDLAITYSNIDLLQKTIYPLLPLGSPSNPKDYSYILYETESKIKNVLATAWIDNGSIVLIEKLFIKVIIENAYVTDIPAIRDVLRNIGFDKLTITTSATYNP